MPQSQDVYLLNVQLSFEQERRGIKQEYLVAQRSFNQNGAIEQFDIIDKVLFLLKVEQLEPPRVDCATDRHVVEATFADDRQLFGQPRQMFRHARTHTCIDDSVLDQSLLLFDLGVICKTKPLFREARSTIEVVADDLLHVALAIDRSIEDGLDRSF